MKGFTLLELILSMAILASFLGLGIPKIHQQIDRYSSHTNILSLRNTLNSARGLARSRSEHITVCPTNGTACSNNWEDPIRVFNDLNLNQVIDEDETLFFTTYLDADNGYWRKSKTRQSFVRFNHLGHAFSSASTFVYCPYSQRYQYAKSIIINFQGRIKIADYLNTRGIPYAKYENIACE